MTAFLAVYETSVTFMSSQVFTNLLLQRISLIPSPGGRLQYLFMEAGWYGGQRGGRGGGMESEKRVKDNSLIYTRPARSA